jgi:ABC-type sugar transport system ATPase subunit
VLELVGLTEFAERPVVSLSGGQMQRVALARSLVYQPQLLLLDEPLSNLDAQLRLRLRDDLRRIIKQTGVTALYVTHDQAEAVVLGRPHRRHARRQAVADGVGCCGSAASAIATFRRSSLRDIRTCSSATNGKAKSTAQCPTCASLKARRSSRC